MELEWSGGGGGEGKLKSDTRRKEKFEASWGEQKGLARLARMCKMRRKG